MGDFFFFLLYLCYGLAFYTMGVAVTARITPHSKLKLNRYLWLFALFAFTHALDEWFELFIVLELAEAPAAFTELIPFLDTAPAFISYCFLLLFGLATLIMSYPRLRGYLLAVPLLLFGLFFFLIAVSGAVDADAIYNIAIARMRILIGFPAAVLAGLGLIGYAASVREHTANLSGNFISAGVALIVYGILTGLVPSGTLVPIINVPVEVLRASSVLFILYFTLKAMRLFDHERMAMIEGSVERFAQTEKLTSLGKLAAGIAHEINNPLANVSLNLEMLKSILPADEQTTKRLSAIERNVERASQIARELLAFSRQDVNEEEAQPLDLNNVLQKTLELLGPQGNDYQFELSLAQLPEVAGWRWKLEEVFLNLIINAMEASELGGKIRIVSRRAGKQAVIEISDSGSGIATEHLRRIFDPFFTTKSVGQGTGLGLAICHGIMERHGGAIDVTSKQNIGTTVTLTFPTGAQRASSK